MTHEPDPDPALMSASECLARAAEAEALAAHTTNPALKDLYVEAAKTWRHLSRFAAMQDADVTPASPTGADEK